MAKRRERKRTAPPPALPKIKCEVPRCESETTSSRFFADGWHEIMTNNGPKKDLLRTCLCEKHFPDTFKTGQELALAIAMGFAIESPLNTIEDLQDRLEKQDEHRDN